MKSHISHVLTQPACRDSQPVQFQPGLLRRKGGPGDGSHLLTNNDSWASRRPCLFTPAPHQHPSPMRLPGTTSPRHGCQHVVPVSGLRATGTAAGHSGSCPPWVQLLNTPMPQDHVERSQQSPFYPCHALPGLHQSLSHKGSESRSSLGFCLKPPLSLDSEKSPWVGPED